MKDDDDHDLGAEKGAVFLSSLRSRSFLAAGR